MGVIFGVAKFLGVLEIPDFFFFFGGGGGGVDLFLGKGKGVFAPSLFFG